MNRRLSTVVKFSWPMARTSMETLTFISSCLGFMESNQNSLRAAETSAVLSSDVDVYKRQHVHMELSGHFPREWGALIWRPVWLRGKPGSRCLKP